MTADLDEKAQEIARENKYFVRAGEAREAKRVSWDSPAGAGTTPSANSALDAYARSVAEELASPTTPIASVKYTVSDIDWYVGSNLIQGDAADLGCSNPYLVISEYSENALELGKHNTINGAPAQAKRAFAFPRPTQNRIVDFRDLQLAEYRRQVEEKAQKLVAEGVEEADALQAAQAQLNESLLDALRSARGSEMQSHYETLQASQFHIIDAPVDTLTVLQGGPGTGKTLVALHRLQYLIDNFPDQISNQVLYVGPSNEFYRYMLGAVAESRSKLFTYQVPSDLVPFDVIVDDSVDGPHVQRLKQSRAMATLLEQALKQRVTDVPLDSPLRGLVGDEIIIQLRKECLDMPYALGRAALIQRLQNTVMKGEPGLSRTVPQKDAEAGVQSFWPRLSAVEFLRSLYNSRERLLAAAPSKFSASAVRSLYRRATSRAAEERWSTADLALLDYADALLGGNEPEKYAYIFVDEAQDLNPMQRLSIARRSKGGAMMILGDVAQASNDMGIHSWADMLQDLTRTKPEWRQRVSEQALWLAYRTPGKILELLAPLSKALAPEAPDLQSVRPEEGQVAWFQVPSRDKPIVTPSGQVSGESPVDLPTRLALRAPIEWALERAKVQQNDPRPRDVAVIAELAMKQSIAAWIHAEFPKARLMTPTESKGMEFDYVVVVDPLGMVDASSRGHQELFVAASRATQGLAIAVCEGDPKWPLPKAPELAAASAELPPQRRRLSAPDVHDLIVDEITSFIRSSVPHHMFGKVLDTVQRKLMNLPPPDSKANST